MSHITTLSSAVLVRIPHTSERSPRYY